MQKAASAAQVTNSITGLGSGEAVELFVLDEFGQVDPAALDLTLNASVELRDFFSEPLRGWFEARGGTLDASLATAAVTGDDEILVLKAGKSCDLWIVRPVRSDHLVTCSPFGTVRTMFS